jgi:hypothetical protein
LGRFARRIAILGWVAVVAIFARVASGGGTLRGVGYVMSTEEPGVVALVSVSLAVAIVAIVALLREASWAWRTSRAGAIVALATSLVLAIDGHDSALVAGLVSSVLLTVGILRGRLSS